MILPEFVWSKPLFIDNPLNFAFLTIIGVLIIWVPRPTSTLTHLWDFMDNLFKFLGNVLKMLVKQGAYFSVTFFNICWLPFSLTIYVSLCKYYTVIIFFIMQGDTILQKYMHAAQNTLAGHTLQTHVLYDFMLVWFHLIWSKEWWFPLEWGVTNIRSNTDI